MQAPLTTGIWTGMLACAMALGACSPEEPLAPQGPAEHGGKAYAAATPEDRIAERVRAELAHDPLMRGLDIRVRGADGRVHLRGFVTSAVQKTRAAEIAGGIEGVVDVDNGLITRARSGATDGPLAEARLYL